MSKADLDNHANQLNPNNDAYWQSRGWDERPEDWKQDPEDRDEQPGDPEQRPQQREGRQSK